MLTDPDIRWHQRLQSFLKAFVRLSEGARLAGEREFPAGKAGVIPTHRLSPKNHTWAICRAPERVGARGSWPKATRRALLAGARAATPINALWALGQLELRD
jgi:hypothetical protein